jgi:hypothetical protein
MECRWAIVFEFIGPQGIVLKYSVPKDIPGVPQNVWRANASAARAVAPAAFDMEKFKALMSRAPPSLDSGLSLC